MTDPIETALEIARVGPLHGATPGRSDVLKISVPGESFVIPADAVSALGDGNTQAGQAQLERMFPSGGGVHRANGGKVPIVAAAGEFIVGPEHVTRVGNGKTGPGHLALRKFVKDVRAKHIEKLRSLPDPAKE